MIYSLAPLEPNRLKEIQNLEREIGSPLIAMTSIEASPSDMDEGKLERIKKLEEELGIILLAVN